MMHTRDSNNPKDQHMRRQGFCNGVPVELQCDEQLSNDHCYYQEGLGTQLLAIPENKNLQMTLLSDIRSAIVNVAHRFILSSVRICFVGRSPAMHGFLLTTFLHNLSTFHLHFAANYHCKFMWPLKTRFTTYNVCNIRFTNAAKISLHTAESLVTQRHLRIIHELEAFPHRACSHEDEKDQPTKTKEMRWRNPKYKFEVECVQLC